MPSATWERNRKAFKANPSGGYVHKTKTSNLVQVNIFHTNSKKSSGWQSGNLRDSCNCGTGRLSRCSLNQIKEMVGDRGDNVSYPGAWSGETIL